MRRLIVELSTKDLGTVSPFQNVKSFEILHILRVDPSEFAALVRVEFGDQATTMKDVFRQSRGRGDAKVEYELMEQEKERTYTYFLKIKSRAGRLRPQKLSVITAGGYLSVPFEVKDGRMKVTLLGNARQVKSALESLEKAHVRCKVVSLMDAKFSPSSPLGRLTGKQRAVLTKAYELGYYDRPRRISSEQLAKKLNIGKSTLVAHRRKAEQRILADILSESSFP